MTLFTQGASTIFYPRSKLPVEFLSCLGFNGFPIVPRQGEHKQGRELRG